MAPQIICWDVAAGEVRRQVRDGNQGIAGLAWWAAAASTSHSSLLLALHPPNHLVMWDTEAGTKVWKKSYADTLLGMHLDPFVPGSALLRCQASFLFVHDLHPARCPKGEGRPFYVTAGKGASPGREGEQVEVRGARGRSTRLRRMVRSMVMGVEGGGPEQVLAHDCLSARYHPALPGTVVLAYPREVLLVDTDLGQTIGVIGLDRAHSPLAALAAGSTRDLLLLLHHSGSVSAWAPRPGLSVASTPLLPKSQSFAAFPPTPSAAASSSEAILEVTYEQRASSDSVRLGKNCKVLGLAVSPNREAEAAFVTTDGRLFILGLRPAARPTLPSLANLVPSPITLTLAAIVPSLSNPPHAIRMCPPLTVKNWTDFQPLVRYYTVGVWCWYLLVG